MLLIPETLEKYQSELHQALEENRPVDAAAAAAHLSSPRVARVLREAPLDHIVPCLLAMNRPRAGQVIGQLPPEIAARVFKQMEEGPARALFNEIPPDHAADILEVADEQLKELLLSVADDSRRAALADLGRYTHASAGGAMTVHFLAVEKGRSVKQTLDAFIAAPPEVERTSYIYVVNGEGRLIGVISSKDLMRFRPEQKVEEVMNPNVIAVHASDPAEEAARLIRNRRFTMLPVVDEADRLIGVITFDDAMDILAEELAEQFAGLGAGVSEESFFTPPRRSVRMRLPWMAANVFLNLGAVAVIAGFEDTIAAVAILAAFLPMITDMGGNVGIQSLSVAIRSIALGEARVRDVWRAVHKEMIIGICNGIALGTLFGIIAMLIQRENPLIGVLAGIALGVNVLVAGVVGGSMPFLIKRLGKDPAMMTGPVLTTITDITGVTIYLGLCTIFLSQLLAGP